MKKDKLTLYAENHPAISLSIAFWVAFQAAFLPLYCPLNNIGDLSVWAWGLGVEIFVFGLFYLMNWVGLEY